MVEFILYVEDQEKSRDFYACVLDIAPSLDVPGMTEFVLMDNCKLGLMPNDGIAKIITPSLPHPSAGKGVPRCELYLYRKDAEECMQRAIQFGGRLISKIQSRDWGDDVGYVSDPDGHVVAFVLN